MWVNVDKTPFLNYILKTASVNILLELNHQAAVDIIYAHNICVQKAQSPDLPYVRNRNKIKWISGGFYF